MKPLPRAFFERPADIVARELLGTRLVARAGSRVLSGLLSETEAYLGRDDPASHAYRGRRHARNASLYGPPATWYVYRSYGIHWCANLVCQGPGFGGAVLLRAILPHEGIAVMQRRRGSAAKRDLSNGPGKLCQALGITIALDGMPMRRSTVLVEPVRANDFTVETTPRIGISKAVDWPLRFVLRPA